ncbi:hypothetical protein KVP02_13500, partial [Halobacterium salinarum]|uniref:hypothetical protein n=1 Tax=Halobacterium salinarum TaxID=2242 RepID=UPI001F3A8CF2
VEVGNFAEEHLIDKRTEKDGGTPDEIRFRNEVPELEGISSTQQEALVDGVQPTVIRCEPQDADSKLAAESQGSSTVETIGDDVLDKWNWDEPDHLRESVATGSDDDQISTSSLDEEFSNTQEQIAVSVDYTAWRWKCTINWEYTSDEIVDSSNNSSILYTNYAVDHEGTDIEEVGIADDEYEVKFQADFDNDLGEICDPTGNICIDLQSSFSPLQQLKG